MKKNTALKHTVFLSKGEPSLAHVFEVKAAARSCGISGENGQILLSGELELEILYLAQEEEKMFADSHALLEKLEEAAREPLSRPLPRKAAVVLPWEIAEEGDFAEGMTVTVEVAEISFLAVSPRALETDVLLSWETAEEEPEEIPMEEEPEEMPTEEAPPETTDEVLEPEAAQESEVGQDEPVIEEAPIIEEPPTVPEAPVVKRFYESWREMPSIKQMPFPAGLQEKRVAEKSSREQARNGKYSMRFYRVLPGETLETISQKTGAGVSAIVAINGLGGQEPAPGDVLAIPRK